MKNYQINLYNNSEILTHSSKVKANNAKEALGIVENWLTADLENVANPDDDIKVHHVSVQLFGNELGLHTRVHGFRRNFEKRVYEEQEVEVIIIKA